MPSPSLTLAGVAFAWPNAAAPVFSHLSAHLTAGWHGLVGPNGAGKSTLLALVAGQQMPTEGTITFDGPTPCILSVPQDARHLPPSVHTLAEAPDRAAQRVRAILRLDPSALPLWPNLSAGERRRWHLGAAIHARPDILLLDEPETFLDTEARAHLLQSCKLFGGIGIIAAHDRALLDALTSSTLLLGVPGGARHLSLPASLALARIQAESDARAHQRTLLRHEVERSARQVHAARAAASAADRNASARTRIKGPKDHDARSMGHRIKADWAASSHGARAARAARAHAEARDALASAPEVERSRGRIAFAPLPPASPIVLSLHTPALMAGSHRIATDVHIDIRHGERVHIRGPNGAGKSTLLRQLIAAAHSDATFLLPQEIGVHHVSDMRRTLAEYPYEERNRALGAAATLGAHVPSLIGTKPLSAGEARKLALALALVRPLRVLALDEPDNHLDLPALDRLIAALADFPGAILLVTHQEHLARQLTTRSIELR